MDAPASLIDSIPLLTRTKKFDVFFHERNIKDIEKTYDIIVKEMSDHIIENDVSLIAFYFPVQLVRHTKSVDVFGYNFWSRFGALKIRS